MLDAPFFLRPRCTPLGELRINGQPRSRHAFDRPWSGVRACLHVHAGRPRIARRELIEPEPAGDLLQAGPLLVAGGSRAIADGEDPEGFGVAAHQFDSDITIGRYPRAALAIAGERLLAVACDGRSASDAGVTLGELAGALLALGASDALNLDGGGSATLVHDGRLRNRPREQHGAEVLGGRPVATAIEFAAS